MSTTQLLFIIWAALLAVVYGIVTTKWIKRLPSGDARVQEIAEAMMTNFLLSIALLCNIYQNQRLNRNTR